MLRKAIVPKPPSDVPASCCAKSNAHHATRPKLAARTTAHDTRTATSPADESISTASSTIGVRVLVHMLTGQVEVDDAHNVLSVKHRSRIWVALSVDVVSNARDRDARCR